MKLNRLCPTHASRLPPLLPACRRGVRANAGRAGLAMDATFPPMEYTQNGARAGFDVDVMNALAKAMGNAWNGLISTLKV